MEVRKRSTLHFVFSDKHKAYIRQCMENQINVAEGAVRAGKTVDNVFAFACLLETSPDKFHLATGSTIANAKLNIGVCNGLGLEAQFRGRCRWGKYQDNECMFVKTKAGERIIIFAGGAKADSFKKIRGNSYGMWIATEINLHHDDTIKEAFNRQLAAKCIKVFWDLNPGNPNAPIYRDYIDTYAKKQAAGEFVGGYNYEHFTIRDNLTVSPERLREIESRYVVGSIWYKRDIEGVRCVPDDLVYRQFAENKARWIIPQAKVLERVKHMRFISIGIDYGGNRSLTTFVASGISFDYSALTVLKDHHIPGKKGEIDADRVNREFIMFARTLMSLYPTVPIKYVFADSEAQYLTNGLRKAIKAAGLPFEIGDSAKYEIVQRIICTNTLLALDRLAISEDCPLLVAGLESAVWDKDKAEKGIDVRLDNGTSDIDILDAFEYSFERFIKKLTPGR